jgi:threonine/homoserine/homoserine lactone efflux protein
MKQKKKKKEKKDGAVTPVYPRTFEKIQNIPLKFKILFCFYFFIVNPFQYGIILSLCTWLWVPNYWVYILVGNLLIVTIVIFNAVCFILYFVMKHFYRKEMKFYRFVKKILNFVGLRK